MTKEDIIREYLEHEFAISVVHNSSWLDMEARLSEYINHLIDKDFGKLLVILYRIDVSELKLRQVLEENAGEHASDLIARLILNRQLEKIKTREKFKSNPDETREESW
ncbi:MAG: hypothetical protein ACHQEM_02745 [Chitinophagales bacterium]